MNKANFDNAASVYDATFSFTAVGNAQRTQVWRHVNQLDLPHPAKIVEVNCGTGEDAHFFHSNGHHIIASDLSPEMIVVAKSKFPEIDFRVCPINDAHHLSPELDMLFSNFGGMNCISSMQLRTFFENCHLNFPKNHRLVLVIMGKKCLWDNAFLLLKGKWKQVGRRNSKKSIAINVDGSFVETWYYSPKDIQEFASKYYRMETKHPIGLHVPPSYLAKFFEKKTKCLQLLNWMDKHFSFSWQANYADHFMISLVPNE